MFNRLTAVTLRLAAASFLLMMSAMPALAQVKEETVDAAKDNGAWKALAMAILFGLAVCVGCFMSPKRGHQD